MEKSFPQLSALGLIILLTILGNWRTDVLLSHSNRSTDDDDVRNSDKSSIVSLLTTTYRTKQRARHAHEEESDDPNERKTTPQEEASLHLDVTASLHRRVHVIVMHHGGAAARRARRFQRRREDWVTLLALPRTPFFESGFPLLLSDEQIQELEARGVEYVLLTGYKVLPHTRHRPSFPRPEIRISQQLQFPLLEHLVLYAQRMRAHCDAFPLHEDKNQNSMLRTSIVRRVEPRTWSAARALLRAMNTSDDDIANAAKVTRTFIRSTVLFKTSTFRRFARWMRLAVNVARRDLPTLDGMETNSKYAAVTKEAAIHGFNQTYYMQHPFLFERLSAELLSWTGAKVCYRFAWNW